MGPEPRGMGLKNEIDKLIQAERKKLAIEDEKDTEYKEHRRQQLQVLRPLLEEVAASIDKNYFRVRFDVPIFKDLAIAFVEVGRIDKEEIDIMWRIRPNSESVYSGSKPSPGFVISGGDSGDLVVVQTEEEVIQYLLPKIAEKVAYSEHLKDRSEDQ